MKREFIAHAIAFSEEGAEIQYMIVPDDVRSEGHVVMSRSAAIAYSTSGPLGSSTSDLRTSVQDLLVLLHAQLDDLPVYEPPAAEHLDFRRGDDDDEDEDVGMGDGR